MPATSAGMTNLRPYFTFKVVVGCPLGWTSPGLWVCNLEAERNLLMGLRQAPSVQYWRHPTR
jgi:hypothetical protein